MRLRILSLTLLAVVVGAVAVPAGAIPAPVRPQITERDTRVQPDPGVPDSPAPEPKPWSYNWVARPLVVILLLFIAALLLGFGIRWVGIGRRTA